MSKVKFINLMMALALIPIEGMFGQEDSLKQGNYGVVSLPFSETTQREVTSLVTVITGEELEKFPTSNLVEALVGKIPSGHFTTNESGPGQTDVSFSIRGFNYLVLVDGAARDISRLSTTEVESVTILHGMTARAIYGYRAKNGVVMVKTKRGAVGEKSIITNLEYGFRAANEKRMPNWLNSYDYARLYNEASVDDGLQEPYSATDLAGYQQGNSLRYPDEDLYEKLFNSTMQFRRANFEYNGGDKVTQYYFNLNYVGEGNGYLKNKSISYDNLRLRSNIDVQVSDVIKMKFDAIGELGIYSQPKSENSIWTAIGQYPSNAFPIVIAPDTFGTSASYPLNPYASIVKEDMTKTFNRSGQFNLGFDFDLGLITDGLTASVYGTYDIYNFLDFTDKNSYRFPLFETQWLPNMNGEDSLSLKQYGTEEPAAGTSLTNNSYYQRYGANANISYSKSFLKHSLNALLSFSIQEDKERGEVQVMRSEDLGFALNYGYANKYFADVVLSYTGSMHFNSDKRFGFFPSYGLGWIVSEENFLKDVSAIDFLKIRASYGTMGSYDAEVFFPFRNEWEQSGSRGFGRSTGANPTYAMTVALLQTGNNNIDWGKQAELDLGVETSLFKNSVSAQLDYFHIRRSEYLMTGLYPTILGEFDFYNNIGEVVFKGFDGSLNYTNKVSALTYSIGLNFGYNTSEIVKDNRPVYDEPWRSRIGNPIDAVYGYSALGLFSDQTDIDNSPDQSEFGTALPGNIKYENLSDDNAITASDENMIGHWQPRFKYGANLNMAFKGFELFVLGYGIADRDINMRTNPYYYAYSNNKYSEFVLNNRWTAGNPDAAHPRLTTGTSTNDNRNSSYWLKDGSYFKIKNVELAYNFSDKMSDIMKVVELRIFVRGTNLATFSKIKELDPESISNNNRLAGVNTYPSFITITGGITLKF